MRLDLTAYMWRIEKKDDLRVRMLVYTAPGWAANLARRLREQGVRARTRARTCVAVDRPRDIQVLLHLLGADGRLAEAAEAYAAAYSSRPSQFQELSEAQRRDRRHAAAGLLQWGQTR